MSKTVRAFCIFLSVVLLLSSFVINISAQSTAYINGTNVNIRADASTTADSLGQVSNDYVVLLGDTKQGADYLWYKINYKGIVGYLYGNPEWFSIVQTPPVNSGGGNDKDFEQQLLDFPADYRTYLRALHQIYPNWKFVADKIPFTFDAAVDAQYLKNRKHVELGQGIAWRSLNSGAYNWSTNEWKIFDSDRWVAASREVISYYMDPRNFLNGTLIYMFLNQAYDAQNNTEAGLASILKGTFLAGKYQYNAADPLDSQYGGSYSKVIMAAAQASGVSPYIIASKIIVEQGSAGTSLISGTYPGYEGYYNFFNWGAYGVGTDAVVRAGLETAKQEGWNSRAASIIGGANKLADGYVNNKQHTYYYMAFNVLNQNYNHQYASAIYDAYNKAQKMSNTYAANNDAALVFSIPVYTFIPETIATKPEKGDNRYNNYYLTSMSVSGLSPAFDMYTKNYSLSISGDTTIYVKTPDTASVVSAVKNPVSPGANSVNITVKSQSGYTNTYTVNVTSSVPCTVTVTTGDPITSANKNGDVNNDGVIDVIDVAAERLHILGIKSISGDAFLRGDINSDGVIDVIDVAALRLHILGKKLLSD